MNNTKIDFSAFNAPELTYFTNSYKRDLRIKYAVLAACLFVFLAGLAIFGVISFVAIPFFFLPLFVFIAVNLNSHEKSTYVKSKDKNLTFMSRLSAFAHNNNLVYKTSTKKLLKDETRQFVYAPDSIGELPTVNQEKSLNMKAVKAALTETVPPLHTVSGYYHHANIELSCLGTLNRRQSSFNSTKLSFKLPKKLPHIVIDSVVHNLSNGVNAGIPVIFDKNQVLQVQGQFDEYFKVYTPKNYHISALSILTPDVLELIMKHGAFCDIEIVDSELNFYTWGWPDSSKEAEQLFHNSTIIYKKLKDKLSRANVFATAEQEELHIESSNQTAKLKKSKFIPLLLVGISAWVITTIIVSDFGHLLPEPVELILSIGLSISFVPLLFWLMFLAISGRINGRGLAVKNKRSSR